MDVTTSEVKRPRRSLRRRWLYLAVATVVGGLVAATTVSAQAAPGATMSGEAYGVTASLGLLGNPPGVLINKLPDTGLVTTDQTTAANPACVNVPGTVIVIQALCAGVNTHRATSRVSSAATTGDVKISIAGIPTIELRAVKARASVTCTGAISPVSVAFLKIGNTAVISRTTTFSTGKTITVGPINIVFHEMYAQGGPDRSRLVTAVHIRVNVPKVAFLDLTVSTAYAAVTGC